MTSYRLIAVLLLVGGVICIEPSKKLAIDTDCGSDDAAAILLALSAWKNGDSPFEVVAITCVNGNAAEPLVEKNVLKTLTVANVSDIPVYAGAREPLIEKSIKADYYFGADGLGDFLFEEEITIEVDKSLYAPLALSQLAKKYRSQLNVLCLGPLTNIAIAAAVDPTFMNNVKRFYVMGGAAAGVGNISPGKEFNFAIDPESNEIVLNSSRDYSKEESILLYPWETVLNSKIPKSWRTDKLGSVNSKIVKFLNKAEAVSLKYQNEFWDPADLQATAVMIWPHLSTKSITTNVAPVIDGAARGSMLTDYKKTSGKPANVEVIQELDAKGFMKKLLSHFS